MTIDIYCAGLSEGESLQAQGGCGIVLAFTDAHGRAQYREFHYGLGCSSQVLCDFQAIRLALAAVAPAYRSAKTTVHTDSIMVADALSGSVPATGKAATEAKRWYGYYKNIHLAVHGEPDAMLTKAQQLARRGLDSQRDFDSTTVQELANV